MISKEELEKLFSEIKKFDCEEYKFEHKYKMAYTKAYTEVCVNEFEKFDQRIKYRIVWR